MPHSSVRALRYFTLFAFALSACANPSKLARQSAESLAKGDLRKAYDRALSAIEKDPQHEAARAAYNAASARVAADYRSRVSATALADTATAANLALEYRRFQLEVAQHATTLPPAPEYARVERVILDGAARVHYQRGVAAMNAQRPKVAIDEFIATRRYVEEFQDVSARLDAARREATVYVAVFPFADRVGVPGLAQEIGDAVQNELSQRADHEFRFTHVVSASELERNMTVAQLRDLTLPTALDVGRRVGARWVVVGRFRGLRSSSSQRSAIMTLYHRVDVRDTAGRNVARWDPLPVPIMRRQRDVTTQFDFDIVDVTAGAVLAHRERTAQTTARVAWTEFTADSPFDRYALLPPDIRRTEPQRAKSADAAWKEHMGSWDVRDFMRNSREQRSRLRYAARYRPEFYDDTRNKPAWLGELPSESELAFVALHEVWRDVLGALKELDARD